ncbi:MAG TPA: hypothetical protein DCX06_08485 [Opitutae bacterium]|nr:hypothetical protein [Opitutae bacterium]
MPKRLNSFIETLEAIHSPQTPAIGKLDLLLKLTAEQKQLSESDLASLKDSNNPAVKDWLEMQN